METGNLGVVDKDNGDSARVGNDSSIEKPSNVSILIVIRSPAPVCISTSKNNTLHEAFQSFVDKAGEKSRRIQSSVRSLDFLCIRVFPIK